MKGEEFIQLTKISAKSEIGQKYRYELGPLLIQCFEDKFGRIATANVIRLLLINAESETLTLNHWKAAAIKSIVLAKQYEKFKSRFIANPNFKEHIIESIQK